MIKPPNDIVSVLLKASKAYSVPYSILQSVAYHESRYNPNAVSPVGAKGLMQIMPVNYETYGITDPFDPIQSANAGAKMLSNLKNRFGNWSQALAAYNWGIGNVTKKPNKEQWPQSTQKYVASIIKMSGVEKAKEGFISFIIGVVFAYTLKRFLLK